MKEELVLSPAAGHGRRPAAGEHFRANRRDGVGQQFKTFSWQMNSTGWFIVDFVAAYLSVWLAHWLVPQGSAVLDPFRSGIVAGAVVGVVGHVLGLHDTHHERRQWKVLVKIGLALVAGSAVLGLLSMELVSGSRGLAHLALIAGSAGAVMAVSRSLAWQFVSANRHRVCVIGAADFCKRARSFLRSREGVRPLDVTTVQIGDLVAEPEKGCLKLRQNGSATSFVLAPGVGSVGERFDLEAWATVNELDEVVVQGYSMPVLGDSLLECLDAGIRVTSFNEFVESTYRCVPVEEIDHSWFLASESKGLGVFYQAIKRGLEVMVGLLGMVLSLPLVAVAALAIRAGGKGPVFYSQVRVGLRNQPFRIYKLRTMRTDAEADGAKWASTGDPRVTAVGRLLRKTRLDEVPQFWNIVKGDMAFIGPRPERPEFVGGLAEEVPFYNQRHLVKPGLTGWAQINCAYAASAEDTLIKLKYDLYYVKHASLELDLHILVRTVGAIMKGAR